MVHHGPAWSSMVHLSQPSETCSRRSEFPAAFWTLLLLHLPGASSGQHSRPSGNLDRDGRHFPNRFTTDLQKPISKHLGTSWNYCNFEFLVVPGCHRASWYNKSRSWKVTSRHIGDLASAWWAAPKRVWCLPASPVCGCTSPKVLHKKWLKGRSMAYDAYGKLMPQHSALCVPSITQCHHPKDQLYSWPAKVYQFITLCALQNPCNLQQLVSQSSRLSICISTSLASDQPPKCTARVQLKALRPGAPRAMHRRHFAPWGAAHSQKRNQCADPKSATPKLCVHMCTWVVKSGISVLKLFIELDICKPCCCLFCYESLRPCWTCSRCGVEGVQDKWQMHRKAPHGVKIGAERSQLHSPQCVSFLPMRCQWQIRTVKRCRLRMAVRYKLYKATADRSRDLTRAKLHAWEATWHTMVTM